MLPGPSPLGHALACQCGDRHCRDGIEVGVVGLNLFITAPDKPAAFIHFGPQGARDLIAWSEEALEEHG